MLAGDGTVPPTLEPWFRSPPGSDAEPARTGSLPEPYLGGLDRRPAGVFLTATPGPAYMGAHGRPDFQSPSGVFAQDVRRLGSYSAWARSWAYMKPPWTSRVSARSVHQRRLQFLRHWHGDDRLGAADMVTFTLYPWHTVGITTRLRPVPDLVRAFVFEPILELGGPPVFTFGPPWFAVLPALGFVMEAVAGAGRDGAAPTDRSRAVALFLGPGGLEVYAERHPGSPYPPPIEGVSYMRKALANIGVSV
jgi:hypothetical protein